MNTDTFPRLIEPDALEKSLGSDNLLIVDLSKPDNYRKLHVPGAVHIDYGQIISMRKPVMGLLPDNEMLEKLFSAIGIDADTHVVAYDDEGGGRAGERCVLAVRSDYENAFGDRLTSDMAAMLGGPTESEESA